MQSQADISKAFAIWATAGVTSPASADSVAEAVNRCDVILTRDFILAPLPGKADHPIINATRQTCAIVSGSFATLAAIRRASSLDRGSAGVRLISRNDNDLTSRFPLIAKTE
jgi:hypothetical protein